MSKSDEYLAHANECQRMAEQTRNPGEKQAWLQLAESWMRMIRQRKLTASDQFDAAESATETHQQKSTASH